MNNDKHMQVHDRIMTYLGPIVLIITFVIIAGGAVKVMFFQ